MIKLTLKLFNAVERKDDTLPIINTDYAFYVGFGGAWAQNQIHSYMQTNKLTPNQINKTFHKSWDKISSSSEFELRLHQIMHYLSTYGSNFTDEVYIPDEVLDVPDLKLKFKMIQTLSPDEIVEKCLGLLRSGIALKDETIHDVLNLLEYYDYKFSTVDDIKNKEAMTIIIEKYNVLPTSPTEMLRFVLYKTTGETLLIKDGKTVAAIQQSTYNPSKLFSDFGLHEMSSIFNRFKPLFLAYKGVCPRTINRLSKLSKMYHKPMAQNPLNLATSRLLLEGDMHWLDNASVYTLFKALNACYMRSMGQDTFTYRIRNGKSWTPLKAVEPNRLVCLSNYNTIAEYLSKRVGLLRKRVYIPENIQYALPTSEKMFIGNIPEGTKITGKQLAVGVYWENSWGASDLDLSAISMGAKIGWNSSYRNNDRSLMYSGDLTNAQSGAVEYMYAGNGLDGPAMLNLNVYSGKEQSGYKLIIGDADDISRNYMMNPNNLVFEYMCETLQNQSVLGIILPEGEKVSFVMLNFSSGKGSVSAYDSKAEYIKEALTQQYTKNLTMNHLLAKMGVKLISKEELQDGDIDLSVDALQRDTFIKLFEAK